jgi:hypothetical protein
MSNREKLCERDEELLCADGFDEAIAGVAYQFGGDAVVLYDRDKCIDILIEEGLSYEDAIEHFEYNVSGAYVGPKTPIFAEIF